MPTTKALSASKFFGKDRYEYYLNELLTQQKVGGNVLSKSQIKEGFLKRKDKISFEKFVEKVISTKTAKSAITPPEIKSSPVAGGVGLGSRGGALVKSPTGSLEKYVSGVSKPPGVSKPKKMGGIEDDISKITKSVISIAEILSGQKKLKDSSTSYDRRKAEQEKRGLAESKLEKRFDGLKKAAEKILAPVKSLLDKIINFFVTVFLGRIVYKLLEWFGDPKNADKVKSISRFLKDFGPAILTAFVLFGTSFGRLTLGLTKMIGGFVFKIGKVLIPQLLKLIAKNPKVALAAGLFTAGATIPAMFPGTVDEQEKKTKSKPGSTEDKIKALEQQKANLNPLQKMQGVGSEIDEQLSALKTGQTKSYGFSGGGLNFKGMMGGALGSSPEKPEEMPNGFVSGEKGVDKVPAMLTDGEFVMSTGAVRKYGVDTLEGMNAAGGGTNRPKMMNGKTYAEGGGRVGYGGNSGGNENMSMNFYNIKNFIKQKMGYDVDKPETWGSSFSSVFTDKSSGSKPPKSQGKGFDFISTAKGLANQAQGLANQAQGLGQGLANQGMGLVKTAADPRSYGGLGNQAQGLANQGMGLVKTAADPRSYGGLGNQAQGLVNQGMGLAKSAADPRYYQGLGNQAQDSVNNYFLDRKQNRSQNKPSSGSGINIGSGLSGISSGLGKNISNIADKPYFGETAVVERERKLGLMKPGASSLTKETRDRLVKSDNSIKNLYDPEKDKGPLGLFKKVNQDIQDKGLISDPLSLLKTERFEKGVERISRGKIKNFGAALQGTQMSLKALAGPLGRAFRVEDRGSLGRYLKPAMLEVQKQGNSSVGAKSLTQPRYNELLPNKFANFALGQTSFNVDKSGRARTGVTGTSADEVWDFNQTAQANFGQSRSALKALGDVLQGKKAKIGQGKNEKDATIGNAAFETLFKGMSGIYRTLQNTTYGNLRPMGSNIDLGGGFKQTDARGNVLSPKQMEQMEQQERERLSRSQGSLYSSNDPRRKNTGQPYQSKFARPKNAGTSPVNPPIRPARPTTLPTGSGGGSGGGGRRSSGTGSQTPSFSARNPSGSGSKEKILGLGR